MISADWGSLLAGGYLAVAGSQGSLVIYSVDKKTGTLYEEMRSKSKDILVSIKWSPKGAKLACGSSEGKVGLISYCPNVR